MDNERSTAGSGGVLGRVSALAFGGNQSFSDLVFLFSKIREAGKRARAAPASSGPAGGAAQAAAGAAPGRGIAGRTLEA